MVTGANGFLPSYIVKNLLESGHTVHACVRDGSDPNKVSHLQSLPGATERLKLFSTGDLAEVANKKAFDTPIKHCEAVFHAATPINAESSEQDMLKPALISTQELIDCVERHADNVQCLVLTSSMAAVAPRPPPDVKDESHWSDPDEQKGRGNWYGCTKTSQEMMVKKWVNEAKTSGKVSKDFVYAAICPTLVIGPKLQKVDDAKEGVGGTIGKLQSWLKEGRSEAPNDSMSFIHVEDCARMHTRILELTASEINEHQRYMTLIESLHWNDILKLLKELYPKMPQFKSYQGEDIAVPTRFNLENMKSLNVNYRNTKETFQNSIDYLTKVGGLD
jgi:cinnamoyl-CoA reductase